MIGLGPMEFVVLTLMSLGGLSLPLGMPPGEEDALLAKIAPPECTFYFSWAAMAKPDPNSTNNAERLLAEKEVQEFVTMIERALTVGLMQSAPPDEKAKAIAQEAAFLAKTALTHPGAAFVGTLGIGRRGPEVDAAVIVKTGDETDAAMKSLAKLEAALGGLVEVEAAGQKWKEFPMPEGAPRLLWGFRGKYMMIGLGEGSLEGIVKRGRNEPPKWLTDVRSKLSVKRTATVMYLDVKRLLAFATAASGDPEVRTIPAALGLGNVTHVAAVTGLDDKDCITRAIIGINGKPAGLFALSNGKPLTAKDLAVIPQDASLAVALKLDASQLFHDVAESIAKIDPRARAEFDRELAQFEELVGLKLDEDIFKAFGDTWRIYNSPSDGGLVFTGLTGVVTVRDREKIAKAMDRIEKMTNAMAEEFKAAPRRFGRLPRHATIKKVTHEKQTIHFLNFVGMESPFAPAWCLTDKEFVIALFPSQVKAYLSRAAKTDGGKSLADVPEVAEQFKGTGGPLMVVYNDTRELFKLAYPFVQIFGNIACGELQRSGIDVDISMLPQANTIAKHLYPGVTTISKTDAGIELFSRQSTPMGSAITPLLVPAMLFAVPVAGARHAFPPPGGFDKKGFDKGDFKKGFEEKLFESRRPAPGRIRVSGVQWRLHTYPPAA